MSAAVAYFQEPSPCELCGRDTYSRVGDRWAHSCCVQWIGRSRYRTCKACDASEARRFELERRQHAERKH